MVGGGLMGLLPYITANKRIPSYTTISRRTFGLMSDIPADMTYGSIGDTGTLDTTMLGLVQTQKDGIRLPFGEIVLDGATRYGSMYGDDYSV